MYGPVPLLGVAVKITLLPEQIVGFDDDNATLKVHDCPYPYADIKIKREKSKYFRLIGVTSLKCLIFS